VTTSPELPPAAAYPTVPRHPAPPQRPELPDGLEPTPTGPRWKAWTAWVALITGFVAAGVLGAIIIGIAAAGGASFEDPPASVNILALIAQDLSLIGAAVVFARIGGSARVADFGLVPVRFWRGVGWALLTWVAFIVFTAAWVALLGVEDSSDDLPESLGVDESDVALIAVAVLVCVGAPIVEELFFRGFFFTALRSWRGVWPAAIITGAIFGLIHAGSADAAFLLPLGFFGFALCLLYVRTGSLVPCIGAHALNNSLAFGASQDWDWQILPLLAGSLALIAAVLAVLWRVTGAPRQAVRSAR
jgi:membrane protease YdiL (CAAX protease family)